MVSECIDKKLISLVMIVKNEEEILDRCLESVKSIVDEYVIVDTGSTDCTKEIIKKYGNLYEIEFVNYVETKNLALELATGKYVLFMDADEVIFSNAEKLKEYALSGVDAIQCKIQDTFDDIVTCEYDRIRLWKNDKKWKFCGPGVHEYIFNDCDKNNIVIDKSIIVKHLHDKKNKISEQIDKFPKYVNILKNAIKKNGNDCRAWFYLGRTYKDLRENIKAIGAYKKYLLLNSNFRDEIWQSMYDIAVCYGDMGEYAKSMYWCDECSKYDSKRSESYNLKGLIYFRLGEYNNSLNCYKISLTKNIPSDITLFLNPAEYNFIPLEMAYICCKKLHLYREAEILLSKLIENFNHDCRYLNEMCDIRKKSNPKIFMILGNTPEPVWGDILNQRGVHGVETAFIELSNYFAKNNCDVFMFCNTTKFHSYSGVYYIPMDDILNYIDYNPDIVITSREYEFMNMFSCKKILWMQDATLFNNYDTNIFNAVDYIVCSSEWHKSFISQTYAGRIDVSKILIIPLGIDKLLFENKFIDRNIYKFIYASNPNRGLKYIIDWWPDVLKIFPMAELNIYYGWDSTMSWSSNNDYKCQIESEKNSILSKIKLLKNINVIGRRTRKELIYDMQNSGILVYPNDFSETFCLTALEAQAAGMIIITTDMAALSNVVRKESNVLICNHPSTDEYKNEFLQYLCEVTKFSVFEKYSNANINYALVEHPSWDDISNKWLTIIWRLL